MSRGVLGPCVRESPQKDVIIIKMVTIGDVDEAKDDDREDLLYFSGRGHHKESWRGEMEFLLGLLALETVDSFSFQCS